MAEDLIRMGVRAMKVWPFDATAPLNQAKFITPGELQDCPKPVQQIRDAVSDSMEIAMEFHGYWNLPSPIRIAQALEPYGILWLEEMLPQDYMQAYRQLANETCIPLWLSERYQFREVVEQGIARFVMPDICWCGGISEAKKIATLAETHYLPIAPHNCGDPILHFAMNATNLFILESVRRHYLKEYEGIVTNTGSSNEGWLKAPSEPGLGVDLHPSVFSCADLVINNTTQPS